MTADNSVLTICGMKPSDLLASVRSRLSAGPLQRIADASGVSTKQLARIRDGKNSPTVDTLERICAAIADVDGSEAGRAAESA